MCDQPDWHKVRADASGELHSPQSARSLQLPGGRVSTGPVFIIELGLYFGVGARLITAYNAQGETRHHLTVAVDSRPVGWDAIRALGREGRGVLSLPEGRGAQHVRPGSTSAPSRPWLLVQSRGTHHTRLALHEASLPPCSPQATRGSQRDRQPHLTEKISEDETHPKR